MRISLPDLLFSMPNLHCVLGGIGAADRQQISVDKFLHTIVGFGSPTQEGVANSVQGAVDSFKICRLTAKVRRLREQLDALEVHCHYMRIQLRFM